MNETKRGVLQQGEGIDWTTTLGELAGPRTPFPGAQRPAGSPQGARGRNAQPGLLGAFLGRVAARNRARERALEDVRKEEFVAPP